MSLQERRFLNRSIDPQVRERRPKQCPRTARVGAPGRPAGGTTRQMEDA
jgi:hypothetical protein